MNDFCAIRKRWNCWVLRVFSPTFITVHQKPPWSRDLIRCGIAKTHDFPSENRSRRCPSGRNRYLRESVPQCASLPCRGCRPFRAGGPVLVRKPGASQGCAPGCRVSPLRGQRTNAVAVKSKSRPLGQVLPNKNSPDVGCFALTNRRFHAHRTATAKRPTSRRLYAGGLPPQLRSATSRVSSQRSASGE